MAHMENPRRRFTILDGMAIVAVVAIGIWLFQANLQAVHVRWAWEPLKAPLGSVSMAYRAACVLHPIMMVLAAVLLLLGLIPPRPRFNMAMRRPGTVACSAITCVAVIRLLRVIVGFVLCAFIGEDWKSFVFGIWNDETENALDWFWLLFFVQTEDLVAQTCISVAASWAVLKSSGCWHSDSGWLDQTGRVLGIFYLLITPVLLFRFPLPHEGWGNVPM